MTLVRPHPNRLLEAGEGAEAIAGPSLALAGESTDARIAGDGKVRA